MIGHLNALPELRSLSKLGAAAALLSVCLAAPSAQANSLKGPDDDIVNGQYCNSLCKAYMAWSDRMLSITQPSHARPQVRVALPQPTMPPKKMDKAERMERPEPRMAQHAPKSHRPGNLESFAQLPSGSHAAQSAMDTPRSDEAADYGTPRMAGLYGSDPVPPRSALADMRRAASETADMRLVSMTDNGMAQGAMTVGDASGSGRSKMPSIWIVLAAAALVAFFGHGWLKRRNGTSEEIG